MDSKSAGLRILPGKIYRIPDSTSKDLSDSGFHKQRFPDSGLLASSKDLSDSNIQGRIFSA